MRVWKGLIAGALALGGLVFAQAEASARPMTAPALIDVSSVATETTTGAKVDAPTCQWRRHHGWRRGYGWHPRYGYGPRRWHGPRYGYGWHHPRYGWHQRRRHFY